MNKRLVRRLLIALAVVSLMPLCAWGYTSLVVARARTEGEFDSAEAGMLVLMDHDYKPDRTVTIHYAGPNEDDRSMPYIWYVSVEVRASAHADGSELRHNGCDSGGAFFVQLKDEKWVHVPEGLFIIYVPSRLDTFGYAGKGQLTPKTDLIEGPMRFCT